MRIHPLILLIGLTLIQNPAHASLSEDQYREALQIAQKKVARINSVRMQTTQIGGLFNSQANSMVVKLYGRNYQVGDHWDVAAWQFDDVKSRATGNPDHLQIGAGRVGIFHYEVLSTAQGENPEITLRVTELDALGFQKIDPKVNSIDLTLGQNTEQTHKSYSLEGSKNPVVASAEGVHSRVSPLELFPLDAAEVATAERSRPSALPTLPPSLDKISATVGFGADLSQSFWFEQDDFFGRPVQVLWQMGDPWPSYLRTANGVAILIRRPIQ